MGTLDHHLADAGLPLMLQDVLPDGHILVQQAAVLCAACEPTAVPSPGNADAESNWIYFLTH